MALVMERDDILKRTIDKVSTLIYSHRISTNPSGQCVNAFSSQCKCKIDYVSKYLSIV